jgi:YhcH/YjgK/YiaL family protein
MILDSLASLPKYIQLNVRFAKVLEFIRRVNLDMLPPGRHEIDGDAVYVSVVETELRKRNDALLEAHRRYIDVQVILEGTETMGWAPLATCSRVNKPYVEPSDIEFYEDDASSWIPVQSGQMAIFFPQDAHAPLVGDGRVRKLIFKVLVD